MLACVVLMATACRKTVDAPAPVNPELAKLPAETRTGANTLGMLLNNKAWVAQTNFVVRPTIASLSSEGLFDITAYYTYADTLYEFSLTAPNIKGPGVYKLQRFELPNEPDSLFRVVNPVAFINYSRRCIDKNGMDVVSGQLEITHLDRDKNTISGRFSLVTKPTMCNPTMVITDGRFDTQYNPY